MGFDRQFKNLPAWQIVMIYHCLELNEIQDNEYVIIIASLKYTLDKRYNCNSASSYVRNGKMPDQARVDAARGVRGCYKEITDPTLYHRHSNIIFKRCPCVYFDQKINTLLDFNEYFKQHKTLPDNYIYKTGRMSAKMSVTLKIVDNFIEERKAEEVKKQTEAVKQKQGLSRGRK